MWIHILLLGITSSKQILHYYTKTVVSSLLMWAKCSNDGLCSNFLNMFQCLRKLNIIDPCFLNFSIYMDH